VSASTVPTFLSTFLGLVEPLVDNTMFGPPTTNEEMSGLYVMADESGASPIVFDQSWAGSGSMARDEKFTVPCLLFARTGDNDEASATALFDAAMTSFEAVAGLFRSDASLGITGKTFRAQLTSGACLLLPRPNGLLARVAFTITAEARI
jgi:hypothetical protein